MEYESRDFHPGFLALSGQHGDRIFQIADDMFQEAVLVALGKHDRHFGTPNNWTSMLFAGIESNPAAITFLNQKLTLARALP